MKKIKIILLLFFTVGIFILNVTSQNGHNESIKVHSLEKANAQGCALQVGDPVSGTMCIVRGAYYGNYYFTFNTATCSHHCDEGGSNCCYDFSATHMD
jgi:hypothetical protein